MEKHSVLIVDDTPNNLKVLTKMLLEKGYLVRPVTNGPEALEIAGANPPDLILLDVNMPGMNGYEVCARLKSDDRLREIPVIFLTAMTDEADKIKAFSLGGVDYITKPFELYEVEARIKTHLTICIQKKRLQESLEEKYRNIFEHAIEGIFQMTSDGQFITANPQCALIYGYDSPDEMITEINAGKRKIYASKSAYEQFLHMLETDSSISMFETQAVRNDGETIWVSINARVIRSDKGKALFYDCFIENITERKKAETELRETNIALKVLIRNLEESRKEQENNVSTNFNTLILPYLQKIENMKLSKAQKKYMDVVRKNLNEIVSPFVKDMKQYNLTPTELQVAYYIRDGKSTKDMADILNLSVRSIDFYRYNIRRKLRINNNKVNLRSHLLSLEGLKQGK